MNGVTTKPMGKVAMALTPAGDARQLLHRSTIVWTAKLSRME